MVMKESIFEMIAIEGCPKRIMNLFVVVAMSEKTSSETVHIVNDVMGKILLACDEVVVNEEAVDIKVSVLKASCGVAWAYDEPKPLQDFQWHGIETGGRCFLGKAFKELNEKLSSRKGYLVGSGSYPPFIILMTDGLYADDYDAELLALKNNNWFKYAVKVAIPIGVGNDKDIFAKFTDSAEMIIDSQQIWFIKYMITPLFHAIAGGMSIDDIILSQVRELKNR